MTDILICPHGCGKKWIGPSARRVRSPLDREAVAAADQATSTNCARLTNADGTPRQLTMADDDACCRRVWMEAYMAAFNTKHGRPEPPQPRGDPTDPVARCEKANLVVKVTDYDGKPVKDAIVNVRGLGCMFTDNDGYADYDEVSPSTYDITAEKEHYVPAPDEPPGPATTTKNVLPNTTTVADLQLHVDQDQCTFDVDIKLIDHSDDRTLTPLRVSDYDELRMGTTENQDYVKFEIEIKENQVDKLDVEITEGQGASKKQLFRKELEEKLRIVGTHEWRWDGYNNADILDTKTLKDPHLQLELRAELCGETKTKTIHFNNEAAEQDWVDVVIDRHAKAVTVALRVNLQDGGDSGVGELPPAEIWSQTTPNWNAIIPKEDPRRQAHERVRSFNDLKNLALAGLEKYWSRNARNGRSISTPAGTYTVDTKPNSVTAKAMDDIDVEYNTNGKWRRSSNPGKVRGFVSLVANFLPERSVYNVGWIRYEDGWGYAYPTAEDDDFQETTAHEIGHGILSAYGGELYSYGHRGSSTVITQKTLSLKEGGISYPTKGDIDLMKYYNGFRPRDFFARVVASETDVTSLIWLARVTFHD